MIIMKEGEGGGGTGTPGHPSIHASKVGSFHFLQSKPTSFLIRVLKPSVLLNHSISMPKTTLVVGLLIIGPQ